MKPLLLLTFCSWSVWLYSQNLIPNSDLTYHHSTNCLPAYKAMNQIADWYSAGGSIDYYLPDCHYKKGGNYTGSWDFGDYPDDGNGFIGFWGVFKTDYTMASEVIAVPLIQPLEAGQAYYFSVDIRTRGKYHPAHHFPFRCPSANPLALQIYLNDSKIQCNIDENHAVTGVHAQHIAEVPHHAISDTFPTYEWTTITACFTAQGGETDIAFSLNIEPFTPDYPCVDGHIQDEWFSLHYVNLDNFLLTPIPQQIRDTLLLCEHEKFVEFDMREHFEVINLEELYPNWSDGQTDMKRLLEYEGEHQLDLEIDCGRIETTVVVETTDCRNPVFVPNAFTPNFDGKNDILRPFFNTSFQVDNYEFSVFNRWGNIVHRSTINNPHTGWDGMVNGKNAEVGTYIWSLRFDYHFHNKVQTYELSGDVLLIR